MNRIVGSIIFISLLWAVPASAHKLNLFVWVEGEKVTVESSLSGGRTLVNGEVRVVNTKTEKTIITGKTDDQGTYTFIIPEPVRNQFSTLDIVVNGGDGHQAQWRLNHSDYTMNHNPTSNPTPPDTPSETVENPREHCLSNEEFELLLDQHLEKKLEPLRRSLSTLTNPSPTLKDIGGGIGYLIGGAGILAWIRSRRGTVK